MAEIAINPTHNVFKKYREVIYVNPFLATPPVVVPVENTFIGGVASTIYTAQLLATKLAIDVSRVINFSILGSDIKCTIIDGAYFFPDYCFANDTGITYYDDKEGLVTTSKWNSSFSGCLNMVWARFPKLDVIAYQMFINCTSLIDIYFSSVLKLRVEAFKNCTQLVNLNNSFETITSIESGVFSNAKKITSLYLPNLINGDGFGGMFAGMTGLVNLHAPKLTFSVGSGSGKEFLVNCINLETVTLTALNHIPWNGFYGCSKLQDLQLPNATSAFIQGAFYGTSLLVNIYAPSLTNMLTTSFYLTFEYSGITNLNMASITSLSGWTGNQFVNSPRINTIDIRKCNGLIGSSTGLNNIFVGLKTGVIISANIAQQTSNSGAVEGDLAYAVSSRGATVNYV